MLHYIVTGSHTGQVTKTSCMTHSYTRLKTLFNIVEDPFQKLLNFDVCVV